MTSREVIRLMNEEEMSVMRAMREVEIELAYVSERVADCYRSGGRIVYVGSGTSGRIAAGDAAEMPPTFGVEPDRFIALQSGGWDAMGHAIENAEDDEHAAVVDLNELELSRKDLLIALAASGKTPYVLSAVRHARQKGVWTCGIVNNPKAPLLAVVDYPIVLDTGPEVLTGSTRLKAGTAQKLALNRISTVAMVLCGKVIENLMVDVKANNSKLKDRCVRIVRDLTAVTDQEAYELLDSHGWSVRQAMEALRAHR